MKYDITHTTKYAYSEAVPVCHNLVRLAPRDLAHQSTDEFRLLVHPEPSAISRRRDYFGNDVDYFSIDQAHRGLTVTAASRVTVLPLPQVVASETPAWERLVRPSRQGLTADLLAAAEFVPATPTVAPFAELTDYVRASFAPGRPILDAVMELTSRIFQDFSYDPRATTIHTPLREVFENRHGVCQDFAHLQIGCLRGLGLAARYVSGYLRTSPPSGKPPLVGADASHAWLAVYCGQVGWVGVDPTNNVRVAEDYVTIAWGRDYDDVCPIQGVIVGGGEHKMSVSVLVTPRESSP